MIKDLIKIANNLDKKGHRKLASDLDAIILNNRGELRKLSGKEVPAWEAMSHEEHSAIEETPEFLAFEQEEEMTRTNMAEEVAKLIVGGTPVFGEDPETGERAEDLMANNLAELLDSEEHQNTLTVIVNFLEG